MEHHSLFPRKTLCTAVLAALAITPFGAVAQDEKSIEEVTVVGSRIARGADFNSPTPVEVFDRDTIEKSGYNNLQQLFEKSPAAGNGTFSTRGNNQDSTANGAAAVSLRGMGADATLVLVNGRRVAISAFAEGITTNFVDINAIPVGAIERVEVLKDGASAIYGSDAVAGVVNIVLRNDFEGAEVSVGYGDTTDTHNDERTFSAIWGVNGANDSNLTLIFDHFSNSSLMNKDRGRLGTANQSANGGMDFRSSRGYPGRFIVDGTTTIDPACPPENAAGQTCVYDYGPWNVLTPAAERTGLTVMGHTDITDGIEFFTEIAVQHNTSMARGAPTPLDESAALTVPVTHPDNPYTGATTLDVGRYRTVDAGAREWDIETDNLRGVFGLRGEVNGWTWETTVQRARSESMQTGNRSQGWVRTDLLQQEIDAGRYNPFGAAQNPDSVINSITTSLVRLGTSHMTAFDFNVSGELFDLSGGTAAMAAGVEYREEKASDTPDDQFQRGLIFGTESVSASASRDITSAYVEMALPVLDNFDVTVAGRYDDYSDFGSSVNPMVNGRWTINDTLSVRGSWGTGFRAPSLAQIGLGPSQESQFFVDTYGCAINPAYCTSTDYTIIFAGNPELEAEESESFNFGVVYEPVDDLQLSMDYWNITQEGKIDEVPFGYIYTQFCGTQNSTVCVRSAALPGESLGALQSINSGFINIGEQSVTGIDLAARYGGLNVAGGDLSLRMDYSYLVEFERVELSADGSSFKTTDLAGEYEYPQHRWVAAGDWDMDNFGLTASINYTGEFEDTPDIDFDGTADYDTNTSRTVDAFVTLNLQARYTGIENVHLSFGVDNAMDEDVPFAIGDGDSDLYGYVSGQHSPRGRFVYGKMTYSF
ncbi:TonB-dependent receptor [Simiduia aestuariiviva]|uniref:Outer membrane receptor for ferrienterochelin and colicin n=1 Tax=Simiduia aestuariiviva TaxID=1510459 RepID=A0A839UTE9_9GAMM|nr:TonB-dependent receptor [Simiduia aestuariiviva]MBB3170001.1 outer membrane receptor for ferrienterochelin and colicin [Simiduia aestuariiviva]